MGDNVGRAEVLVRTGGEVREVVAAEVAASLRGVNCGDADELLPFCSVEFRLRPEGVGMRDPLGLIMGLLLLLPEANLLPLGLGGKPVALLDVVEEEAAARVFVPIGGLPVASLLEVAVVVLEGAAAEGVVAVVVAPARTGLTTRREPALGDVGISGLAAASN